MNQQFILNMRAVNLVFTAVALTLPYLLQSQPQIKPPLDPVRTTTSGVAYSDGRGGLDGGANKHLFALVAPSPSEKLGGPCRGQLREPLSDGPGVRGANYL
jgi:hypothetical protein